MRILNLCLTFAQAEKSTKILFREIKLQMTIGIEIDPKVKN